jgi:hypothetical protein
MIAIKWQAIKLIALFISTSWSAHTHHYIYILEYPGWFTAASTSHCMREFDVQCLLACDLDILNKEVADSFETLVPIHHITEDDSHNITILYVGFASCCVYIDSMV